MNRFAIFNPVPAETRPELLAPATLTALQHLPGALVFEIDPAHSDTQTLCQVYDMPLDIMANAVLAMGKREGQSRYACCMTLANRRGDMNGLVRRKLDVRKASFAPMDYAVQTSGMEYGAGRGAWDNGDYYTALAQAFVEVGNQTVSVKAGKFLSPLGLDSAISSDRFFYSVSDSFVAMPTTQSGIIGTWNVGKKLSVYGGWTNGVSVDGIDDDDMVYGSDLFFDTSDNNAFLGGFSYQLSDRIGLRYGALIGKDETFNNGDYVLLSDSTYFDRDYFMQSVIVDVKLGKKWDYAFEWSLRNEKNDAEYNGDPDLYYWGSYGINQQLIYKYSDKLSFGGRVEWSHAYFSNHFDDPVETYSANYDKYSFVLGANWSPIKRLTIRPEIRYDWFDEDSDFDTHVFSDKQGNEWYDDQFSGGISAYLKF